jgi:hypothetical protein
MGHTLLLIGRALTALASGRTLAQQPESPLPKVGPCRLGHSSSGSYCVVSR